MTDGRPFGGDRSPILDESIRLVFHTVLVLSLFLLFAGHNSPGGGFIGGLVAGSAVFLRYVAGGRQAAAIPVLGFEGLLGSGLLLSAVGGVASLTGGLGYLESWVFEEELPVLGVVKFTATLPFDIGVYLVVIGLVAAIVDSLGKEADETEPEAVRPDQVTGDDRAGHRGEDAR